MRDRSQQDVSVVTNAAKHQSDIFSPTPFKDTPLLLPSSEIDTAYMLKKRFTFTLLSLCLIVYIFELFNN